MTNMNYVWYAGYGSNLSKQRFLCYIQGATPTFGKRPSEGCSDPTLPSDKTELIIPYELYFALPGASRSTKNWGEGGVAFISSDETPNVSTRCRLWKITEDQYQEVWGQEGRSWYNKEINLGTIDDIPVKTITHDTLISNIVKPSVDYLKTIIVGLKETFSMSDDEIAEYLVNKRGIANAYGREQIIAIISTV